MRATQISVQLYSLRDHLGDLDSTLARLAAIGAEAVEPFWILDGPDAFAAALERHGLAAPTVQSPFLSDEITFDGHLVELPSAESVFDAACRVGATTVFDPMVPPDRWETFDDVCRIADRLNRAADTAGRFGIRVGYHNHSFEFHHSFDGDSAYDLFVSRLDPRASCSSWMCTGPRSRARTWRRSRRCWAGVCARCTSRTAGPDTIRSKRSVVRRVDVGPTAPGSRRPRHRGDPRGDAVV